ncbi:ParB/RepB/Spo0J family partition protein [Streptomyces flavotricini]|uniref:ParB/RepB/Spo0J family partition protein n=1 Tax=Streptomyces flavotricini TaxID=66888 RepID=UPI003FD84A9F
MQLRQGLQLLLLAGWVRAGQEAGGHQDIQEVQDVVHRVSGRSRSVGAFEPPLDDSFAEDADTLLQTAFIAAVQHENPDPLDEARALQRLVGVHGSQRAVARALGKSGGWVTQHMALLKLTPNLKQAVEDKTLPVEVARRVGQMSSEQRQEAASWAWALLMRLRRHGATRRSSGTGSPTRQSQAGRPAAARGRRRGPRLRAPSAAA